MTTFPPNPPEQIIERLRGEAVPTTDEYTAEDGGPHVPLADAEAAVRAADSWWRSRLESDETVEAVAQTESFRGGPCRCSRCNDERADARHILERVRAALDEPKENTDG